MTWLDWVFYFFSGVVGIQVIYYLFFLKLLPSGKDKRRQIGVSPNLPVSVIVCAKNEAENLKSFLPSILNQDYPKFQIILINDASRDDTLEIMEAFQEQFSNIKIVNVRNNETFWANKKYALTLGIKAAEYEHLLFTDADCKPVSNHWISEMSKQFSESKSIVLGYGSYAKIKKSFLNKLIRFETLLTAVQYFSYASWGNPYMGVGRNLAYTKTEFFKANGFINHIKVRSGDDDLFINEVANGKNTTICSSEESFTVSQPKTSFKAWIHQKRRHISTAKLYKSKHKLLLGIFYSTQLLFWTLPIVLLIFLFQWPWVVGLISFRFLIQWIALGKASKKLMEKDLVPIIPILECFLIFFQLIIFITNLISPPKHWK